MPDYKESVCQYGTWLQAPYWIRKLQIVLTSKKNPSVKIVLGTDSTSDLNIKVTGTKFLALTKDTGTVTISNLDFGKVALIMSAELYKIEIKVGYNSLDNMFTVVKGEIAYISRKETSFRDNETYIVFASEYIASFTQARINFSVNSSVNIYAALKNLFNVNGKNEAVKISDKLKEDVLSQIVSEYTDSKNIIEKVLGNSTGSYQAISDSSLDGNLISITNIDEKRVIPVSPGTILIADGNPNLTSQGLNINLFPVMNLIPGDILKIDNSILNTSSGQNTLSGAQTNLNQHYFDSQGMYMLQEINYTFENRGDNFIFNCKARAIDLLQNVAIGKE